MWHSHIFHGDACLEIEKAILTHLRSQTDLLSLDSLNSTRAAGDAIQANLTGHFGELIQPWAKTYSTQFSRRAMADFQFTDIDGLNYVIDVKTHRLDADFHMPNLISVERLARFYNEDQNYFTLLLISYGIHDAQIQFEAVTFVPIESIMWDCLTIGALGWGQIQLIHSQRLHIDRNYSRGAWMNEFCERMLTFYPRELQKIESRIHYFQRVQLFWRGH